MLTDSMPVQDTRRQFFLRMKCNYHKRSGSSLRSNLTLSSSQMEYSLLQWTGYIHYGEVRRGCDRYRVLSRAATYDKRNFTAVTVTFTWNYYPYLTKSQLVT